LKGRKKGPSISEKRVARKGKGGSKSKKETFREHQLKGVLRKERAKKTGWRPFHKQGLETNMATQNREQVGKSSLIKKDTGERSACNETHPRLRIGRIAGVKPGRKGTKEKRAVTRGELA